MKSYLVSLAAGLLVGIVYSLLNVRSPAPPVIALVGLFGILVGEQVVPVARRWSGGERVSEVVATDCAKHVFGKLPDNKPADCSGEGQA